MNITHATKEQITGDRLKAIFNRQRELMVKYHPIEERSGLCQTPDVPVNLDDKRGQARIKDFAWRLTEELGEALDCREGDEAHYQEELIDGLHFLTELTILTGKDYNTITDFEPDTAEADYLGMFYRDGWENLLGKEETFSNLITNFIKELAMMCNCLKNKPWKQSHMRTDKDAFYNRLEKVWLNYFSILAEAGLSDYDIADVYLRKSQVNQFRQRSNY